MMQADSPLVFQRTIFESEDFELVSKLNSVDQVSVMKLSQNDTYVGIATQTGLRIYQFDADYSQKLIICEGEDFPPYRLKPEGTSRFIKDFDFMGDSLNFVLSVEGRGIFLLDLVTKEIMNRYDFACPESVAYCYPYVFASIKHSILVLNTCRGTAFRYIIGASSLNQNLSYLPIDQHRQRNLYFLHNKDSQDLTFAYLYDGVLMLENLTRESVMGVELLDLTQSTTEKILQLQDKQLNLLDTQIEKKVFELSDDNKALRQTIFVTLHANQIAISKYEYQQTIKIYQMNWVTHKLELVKDLYRGKSPKQVSIHFGLQGIIASISFQDQHNNGYYDATLHIYYPQNLGGRQESNRRYYFKTWTNYNQPHDRLMDTLVTFKSSTSFRVVSVNDFYLYQEFDLTNLHPVREPIKDQLKISWQNRVTLMQ